MRRRKIIIGLLALVLAGVLAAVFWPEKEMPEPVYKWKKLSEWLEESTRSQGAKNPETFVALRSIGTNGIPCYLQWIRYEPSIVRRAQIRVAEYGRRWLGLKGPLRDRKSIRALAALQELQMLGAKAEPAIPLLIASATNDAAWPPVPFSVNKAMSAYLALAQIGRSAVPALLSLMTNQDPRVRASGVAALAFSNEPSLVAQARISLDDPEYQVRYTATNFLKNFVPNYGILRNKP